MLNELSQMVDAIDELGSSAPPLHPRIKHMGKNRELLVVRVGSDANPRQVEVLQGDVATTFSFIEHGSKGCSFPGLNIPTPIRALNTPDTAKLKSIGAAVDQLLALKTKKPAMADVSNAIANLFELSSARDFSKEQRNKFQRSCSELVTELLETFANPPVELTNFMRLLEYIDAAKPNLFDFADGLAGILANEHSELSVQSLFLFQDIIFGALNWKNRPEFGTDDYWREKFEQDKDANQPVYLDVAEIDQAYKRVANSETSAAILKLSLERGLTNNNAEYRRILGSATKNPHGRVDQEPWVDAFSGEVVKLTTEFPQPRVAELGDLKLFSANSKETKALFRYGLGGWQIFPVSENLARRFNSELSKLAGDSNKGKTCCPIPGNRTDRDKRTGKTRVVKELLVAYLEGQPGGREELAEMFGGEAATFSDADFAAIAQPVIAMLEGRVAANPNLNVRLLSFCSIDKGRKQISLNRRFRVADVIRAAKDWQTGTRNAPAVSVGFYDKASKQFTFRAQTTPSPIELASTINRVWSSDAKGGFNSSFQRAISASDAYDIFLADVPLARQKAEAALGLLIHRMSVVLAGLGAVKTIVELTPMPRRPLGSLSADLGAVKTKSKWEGLSDSLRWQSLKAIALFGILLRQSGDHKEKFMQEPIYQLGRLLALADRLHFQYCKFVRTSDEKRKVGKVDSPTELLGNSLFNFALEQPVSALARLAERIKPYKGWADTYGDEDSGLVHWFVGQMSETEKGLDVNRLPPRMTDLDKAKLLLGYLADLKTVDNQGE